MLIAIPLPYYSKHAYDICHDTERGGWLWAGVRVCISKWNHGYRGVKITIRWGCFWRFRSRWVNEVPRG